MIFDKIYRSRKKPARIVLISHFSGKRMSSIVRLGILLDHFFNKPHFIFVNSVTKEFKFSECL